MSAASDRKEIDPGIKFAAEPVQQSDWLRRLVQGLMVLYLLPAIILVLVAGTVLAALLGILTLVNRGAKWLIAHSRFPSELPFRHLGNPNLRLTRQERPVSNTRTQGWKSKSL
jgi:hypothetical protein